MGCGNSIDGTCKEKEDGQEDLSQFELMDKIDVNENLDENIGAGAILDTRGNTDDTVTRQEYEILTSTFHLGMAGMTPEEQKAREQEELSTGPLRVLADSIRSGMKILINCTNNKRLLGRLKAFDRHFNMVLEVGIEMWTEQHKQGRNKGRAELIHKDRFISKMFPRGDSSYWSSN